MFLCYNFHMPRAGFTLIEILVVITILGILIAIILIALFTLRQDAFNVRIHSNIRQLRILAEAAYDSNAASYVNWSTVPGVAGDVTALLDDTDEAHNNASGTPYVTTIIETDDKSFCISAPLHAATGGFVCVDASGVFKITTDACTISTCP